MDFRGRARVRGPARVLYYAAVALLIHAAGLFLYVQISRLLPKPKIDRPVEVVWIERSPQTSSEIKLPPSMPEQETPAPAAFPPPIPAPKLAKVAPPPPEPAKQEKKEPPKPKVPELALLVKPKPPELVPRPPAEQEKPPEPEAPKPKPELQNPQMKKVEVDDEQHVVDEPPPEAAYLSDKNRRVSEETRDTRTNLDKISKGEASASEKSEDNSSQEVGGEDEKVRQLEKAEASSLEKKRLDPTVHNGKDKQATGLLSGTKGQAATGEAGKSGDGGRPGALAMRNVEGRAAPGSVPAMSVAPSGVNDDAPAVAQTDKPGESAAGKAGREGKAGKPGKRGPKLDLVMDDYQRIIGEEALKDEIEIARRSGSHKKGRWEKKRERLHAMLENFTPEVKPGNQTALGTRAAPFAVFIARMHRQIHEIWGFGFLEDLDGKSPSNPMNERSLAVKLEIVLNADGTVDRTTIVRPSGVLTFDVAAIDTIENAGPYQEPPAEIRSKNGKIYLHWTFHRDERQCSPYFADPFILENSPGDGKEQGVPELASPMARQRRQAEQLKRNASPTEGGVIVPRMLRSNDQEAAAARATTNVPTPDDPAAQSAALKWLDAFEAGRLDQLVVLSGVPFSSAGTVVATDPSTLARVWRNILDEWPSRSVKNWKLLSPAGYRAVFGRLPRGGADGVNQLYLAARFGSDWITLDVIQQADGSYLVRGFTR